MFLGIDIGTSGIKAVIVDANGEVTGQASAPLTVSRPQALWSEQDPDHWLRATNAAVLALDARQRRAVQAIGLTGQMHGATLLDQHDQPLRPAILWNDGRSSAECADLETRVPRAREITGNLAMPGFTAPKLLWVQRHEPEVFKRIACVLLPKDFIRLKISGEKISDLSDASGTYWLDVAARSWSDALLNGSGLNSRQMPALVEGIARAGTLRAEVANAWGMPRVPIAGGAGDNAAGAVGVGAVSAGNAMLSLGTSGVSFVVTDAFKPNPARAVHAFCHCLPQLWHQMAVHLSAAVCVDWVGRLTGASDAAAVMAAAERAKPGAELFMPYLSGERTPHNDAAVRGAFLNLDHDTTPERLSLAVLEGVAMTIASGLDAIRDAGTRIDSLIVIGGGARSPFWGEILATTLGTTLHYLEGGEVGPALGAARLARMALNGESAAVVCTKPPVRMSIEPSTILHSRLADQYQQFKLAYHRIKPGFQP